MADTAALASIRRHAPEVVAHYHQQLTAHGWRIQERDSSWLTASRNGVYFQVIPDRRKGGPTFVELVVSDRD